MRLRAHLGGVIAASSQRVHVVVKLDVEPGTAPDVAAALAERLPAALEELTARVREELARGGAA